MRDVTEGTGGVMVEDPWTLENLLGDLLASFLHMVLGFGLLICYVRRMKKHGNLKVVSGEPSGLQSFD
jgi:hypothetical protein